MYPSASSFGMSPDFIHMVIKQCKALDWTPSQQASMGKLLFLHYVRITFDLRGRAETGGALSVPPPLPRKSYSASPPPRTAVAGSASTEHSTFPTWLGSRWQPTSGIMHMPLNLCLLATVIDLGLSLTCEICGGPGNTCDGSFEFCSPGEDKCGITLIEGTGDLEGRSIVKTCIRSNLCDEPFTSVNLGKAGKVWTHLTCCVGDECQMITPTLPPLNTTPNGKTCPACYAVHSLECEAETIQCTGDQFYCLEKSGSIIFDERNVATIIKGCANNAYCNNTQENFFFGGIHNVITANCTEASGVATILPRLSGLFLQVLVGLLLVKALD